MRKLTFLMFFFIVMTSCEQQKDIQANQYESIEIIDQEIIIAEDIKKEPAPEVENGFIKIDYPEFEFTISHQSLYGDGIINKKNKDTTELYLDLGEYIDSAIIEIHHDGIYNIDIYQKHENSLTISNEGPHCDLIDWKHYNSEWIPIKKYNNYDFVAQKYSDEDWQRFIDVDISEIQDAVLEHCGEEWAERVIDIKNYNDYPCSVSMNRILFKIVLTNKETGKSIEQIIVFEVPMGC